MNGNIENLAGLLGVGAPVIEKMISRFFSRFMVEDVSSETLSEMPEGLLDVVAREIRKREEEETRRGVYWDQICFFNGWTLTIKEVEETLILDIEGRRFLFDKDENGAPHFWDTFSTDLVMHYKKVEEGWNLTNFFILEEDD